MAAALTTLAWLVCGQLPVRGAPAELTADALQEDQVHHLATARGHAQLRMGSLILKTDEIRYDTQTRRFEIPGPLFGVDGNSLLTANRAEGTLAAEAAPPATGDLTLEQVRIEDYRWLPPDIGIRARSPAEVRAAGKLLMAVEGRVLRRVGPSHYQLDGVRLSPCVCPMPEKAESQRCRPDWTLASKHAEVHAGSYALLDLPALEIGDLPLPILRPPLLYLPLADRRTGFLLPHLNWQAQNGFLVDEPFYLTLGQSYDLTLTVGDVTGVSEAVGQLGANGVAGPRASAELRYAPSQGTTGRLLVTAIDDLHHDLSESGVPFARGVRGTLRELQLQDFDARDGDRLDLNLVSDARLTGQLTTDLLFSQIPATRSTAFAFHRSDDWLLTLDLSFLQDFQGDFGASNPTGLLWPRAGAPQTVERLPALTLELPEARLGHSPLRFGIVGSLLREGTLGAPYDNLALSGASPTANDGLIPTVSVPQARAAVEQLDLVPELTLPLQFGRFATAELGAQWRQDLWLFESNPLPPSLENPLATPFSQTGARGYPVLDAQLGTQIARDFGSGDDRLRHTLSAEAEVRDLPFQLTAGTVPPLWVVPTGGQIFDHSSGLLVANALPLPYDEIALASGLTTPASLTPGALARSTVPGGIAQGVLHLDQRLRSRAGELARLDVGEYFDGAGPEATFAQAAFTWGRFHASGYLDMSDQDLPCPGCTAIDRSLRRLTEAWADAGLSDARGDALGLTFLRAIAAGAPQLSEPLDLLFAETLAANDPRWALPDISQLALTGNARLGAGVSVRGGVTYQLPAGEISQILIGAGYASPQHCCALDLTGVIQPTAPGQLGFAALLVTIDLGDFAGSANH